MQKARCHLKTLSGWLFVGLKRGKQAETRRPISVETQLLTPLLLLLARCIVAKFNQVNAEPEDSKRSTPATVSFVKAGQTEEGQMVFPHDICTTSKRIDGYIVSRSKRICILPLWMIMSEIGM